jgi:ABC-type polysaccharide/polyol phosphate export permease
MSDVLTIVWREMIILRRRLRTFMFTRLVSPLLYLVTFGLGLGRSVRLDGGGSYLEFVVSGIVAMNSMMVCFNAVASPVSMSRLLYMTFDEYQTAPISNLSYICGQAAASAVRGLLSSAIIVAIAYAFGCRLYVTPCFILILLVNCLIFSFLGMVAAMLVTGHEELTTVTTYVVMPMSFLCGTFFRLDNFPAGLKTVVEFLPLTPASTSLRALSGGGSVLPFNALLLAAYLLLSAFFADRAIAHVRRN